MTEEAKILEALLARRYSCRAYRPEAVPKLIIEQMLMMAQRTASNNNAQPWHVVITTGAGTERFRSAFYAYAEKTVALYGKEAVYESDFPQPRYHGPYKARRRECGSMLYGSVGISRENPEAARGQSLENFNLFGAPHAMVVTTDAQMGPFGAVDCGSYVANFLLAAESLGLGAIAQGAFSIFAPFLREYFSLSDDRLIVCGISFGYPAHDAPINRFRTGRAPLEDTVSWFAT